MNVFAFSAERVIPVHCKTQHSARFSVVFGSMFVRKLQSDLTNLKLMMNAVTARRSSLS
jgi:hypothetical protein